MNPTNPLPTGLYGVESWTSHVDETIFTYWTSLFLIRPSSESSNTVTIHVLWDNKKSSEGTRNSLKGHWRSGNRWWVHF